jgi:hypothetical protein
MTEPDCPNMLSCKLVQDAGFIADTAIRERYISIYCKNGDLGYNTCKRFITKMNIHFCPDFVMPDTTFSIDEIIERFEEFERKN